MSKNNGFNNNTVETIASVSQCRETLKHKMKHETQNETSCNRPPPLKQYITLWHDLCLSKCTHPNDDIYSETHYVIQTII